MALLDVAELAPIQRLLAVAADLWAVDEAIAGDMVATVAFVAAHREYPTAYGLGPQFEELVARWRPDLVQGDDHG